jgi:predicted SAM-dependent methyltransferase
LTSIRDLTGRFDVTRKLRTKVRDVVARSGPQHWKATRDDLAFRYIRGKGIEIGALYLPQRLPSDAHVTYVDVADAETLLQTTPNVWWVNRVDVVDNGETLEKFDDESQDFVIAQHMLEHVEDPIATLETFMRVLRPGGVAFITLPDGRFSFDKARERTTVEHLLRDHEEGPEVSRRQHYEEWSKYVDAGKTADEYAAEDAHHHFHVWELQTFLAFLVALDLPISIEAAIATEPEFSVVFRKLG